MSYGPLTFIAAALGIITAARTNGTTNATSVDLLNVKRMKINFIVGVWTDGTHTFSLQESVDNTTFTAVAAANIVGSATVASGSGNSNTIQTLSYIGTQRYVRAVITTTGATTGAVIGATYDIERGKQP